MLERYVNRLDFESMSDFEQNFKINVPDNFNFAYDIVDQWAKEAPEKIALIWTNEKGTERVFTFSDLKTISDNYAYHLKKSGIKHGDKVMLIMKRRYQFWPAILALHKIGAVAIPASFLLTSGDIIYRCQCASIKAIICCKDDKIMNNIAKAAPSCPTLKQTITTDTLDSFENNPPSEEDATLSSTEHFGGKDPMIMYFTSGTSGEPKMVLHDYNYALAHLVTAAYWHNLSPESIHLTIADTGWGKAVWGKLYGQWIVGAAVFVYDYNRFLPSDMLHKMEHYNITSFCAPPTVYRYLVRENLQKFDLSKLKYVTTAGEALNPKISNKFYTQTGLRIREGFGQTETTCIIGTYKWMDVKPGSMGKANPVYDIKLIDGEICINTEKHRPIGLFLGYYNNEELTNQVWHDGYYHTGDMANVDEDGYFWYIGRKDDIIKSCGYRIGPFEVENALMSHPAVVECAVTGIEDEQRGQIVKATVVLANSWKDHISNKFVKELKDHVKKMTAEYKVPRIIEFVDTLPKTLSGKIQHAKIRAK